MLSWEYCIACYGPKPHSVTNQPFIDNWNKDGHELHRQICRRCSNYIFILDLTPGLIGLCKDNNKTRRETLKFCDVVRLILDLTVHIYFRNVDVNKFKEGGILHVDPSQGLFQYENTITLV